MNRGVFNTECGHGPRWGDVTLTGKAVETEEAKTTFDDRGLGGAAPG
jgi:hypothetical protein